MVLPEANCPTRAPTVTRVPFMQGFPVIIAGSTLILVSVMKAPLQNPP